MNYEVIAEDGVMLTDKYVFFYNGPFSNFAETHFEIEDPDDKSKKLTFWSSEQAFMYFKAKKFGDEEIAEKILNYPTHSPYDVKMLGRQVKNYDDAEWEKVRYDVFVKVNIAKFSQDPNMKAVILKKKYDGKTFVEASPSDRIWGIGRPIGDPNIFDETKWRGRNLLGKCLTEVQEKIKQMPV